MLPWQPIIFSDVGVNQLLKIVHQIYQDINSGKGTVPRILGCIPWHSIRCDTRAFYSNYVSLELLVLSMIG